VTESKESQTSMTNNKVLIIGLDAATFDLIDPWITAGALPNLSRLVANGTRGHLQSVPNLNSIPAWASFMTGVNPAKHGLLWFYERRPDSYAYRYLNGSDLQAPPFWDILSSHGRRVSVINVPMTYPARPLNGLMITGLDAPSEESPGFTFPPGLYREIREKVGRYLIDTNILGYARRGRYDQALKATQEVIALRAATASYLMDRYPWELFVVVFTALDRVQHTFWHFMDPEHPNHDSSKTMYSKAIYQCYAQLDTVVGNLVTQAGPDVNVILVSDHGFGFNQRGYHFLNPWLTTLGLFHPLKDHDVKGKAKRLTATALREVAAIGDGLVPKTLRRKLMNFLPGGRAALVGQLHQVSCDWSRTKAYVDYIHPGIWINLCGREPAGTVAPGSEYEALRGELIERLSDCRDLDTDQPIVKAVRRREEVYHGPHLSKAPDLAIEWNYDIIVSGLRCYDRTGKELIVQQAADIVERRNVSGDHRPEGILLASGPHIKADQEISGAHIMDIAPTVLALMGQAVPAYMDGRVLAEALTTDFSRAASAQSDEIAADGVPRRMSAPAESLEFSVEEAAMVEARLRGLGYIE
jgi:predicted AlkP superfamily phosphohydrolase/phosphomutase